MKRSMILIPAFWALTSPAVAQTAVPAATAAATALVDLQEARSGAREAQARELAEMRSGAAVARTLERSPVFRAERAKKRPGFEAGLKRIGAAQADAMGQVMAMTRAAERRATIAAYARNFSVDELNAILAFQRSPVGVKVAQMSPTIRRQVAADVQQAVAPRAEPIMRAANRKAETELRALMPGLVATPRPAG